jgi:hypothetical protein
VTLRPGLILAAVFLAIYGTLALTVDLPKAAYGFKSDEATYYMMGLSLVHDGDLTYRKEDLVRVWREYPSDAQRYFYGKSFIYPLAAAPFIVLFGTGGFLVLNAVALALVLLCGYLFLHARSGPWPSAILAAAFVMASVVPVYFVQMMPEVFNLSLACLAYFCWLYKEVASPERSPRGTAWLFTDRSDLAAAVLLGVATFSKPTNALLFVAPAAWSIYKRRPIVAPILAFALVAGGLFAVNMAITGDWNYQGGGDRKSYYVEFPFQNEVPQNELGVSKSRETVMSHVIFNPRTFASNLLHNLEYFFIGRYAGMLGYFFPGFFALAALLVNRAGRRGWQWLVLASALAQGLIFVVATPYTWSGGGVGNRYFFSGYGVMLFLLPPIESIAAALTPWVIGGFFVGPLVLNPFVAAFRPADNGKSGPLRLLPVELTLTNDLPVNTDPDKARVWLGDSGKGDIGFLVYFLDDNSYGREADKSFWVRGGRRAEFIIKTDTPVRRAMVDLTAGPLPTDVTVTIGGRSQRVHLDAGASQRVTFSMPSGVPYEKEVQALVWSASVSSSTGFTPIFYDPRSADARYLGVRVTPLLEARPQ